VQPRPPYKTIVFPLGKILPKPKKDQQSLVVPTFAGDHFKYRIISGCRNHFKSFVGNFIFSSAFFISERSSPIPKDIFFLRIQKHENLHNRDFIFVFSK
jgi:hypothetical protein